ncbi:hypothetical protein Q9189_007557 [Teloschistes chrysophthalmus]
MASPPAQETVKTRFCIISDTHSTPPFPPHDPSHSYRTPLPSADVLLHAGDITNYGLLSEYEAMFEMLCNADAELKIVIAGNHDITLDEEYYESTGRELMHKGGWEQDTERIWEMWKGERARERGVVYLEEGVRTFGLRNGAIFTIYTSPYQPEFCNWAFPYERHVDRFNPNPNPTTNEPPEYPIPTHPYIDILLTHGPPHTILDATQSGENVGCEHLLRAVRRCRPRMHCFGHIHEGWGAMRVKWGKEEDGGDDEARERLEFDHDRVIKDGCAGVHVSESGGGGEGEGEEGSSGLKWGEETLFVNAAIMNVAYRPVNAPFRVDLDLPLNIHFD